MTAPSLSRPGLDNRPILLIVNPTAGGGRSKQLLPQVERALDDERQVFRTVLSRSLEHGAELALEAEQAGEVAVVLGGDGLIGAVGGALANTGATMGLIPGGRGNDLARGLGIPGEPDLAVRALIRSPGVTVDVGEANGKRFLGIASVGFDSDANRIANRARILKGKPVYTWAALRALTAWKPVRFTLREGGGRIRFTGYTVAVANNGYYGGGMHMAPEADLADGMLDLVTVGEMSRLRFLLTMSHVFRGTHVSASDAVNARKVRSLEISASRAFTMYADGDPLTELPAKLRVLPAALTVIAPGASR